MYHILEMYNEFSISFSLPLTWVVESFVVTNTEQPPALTNGRPCESTEADWPERRCLLAYGRGIEFGTANATTGHKYLTFVFQYFLHDRLFLIQIHTFTFNAALKTFYVDGRSGGSGRSQHCVRVTFTGHSPAQLMPSAASCSIRFVKQVVSGNQAARMLNPRLMARWKAVVASQAT
jgi:hypothetical protein